jgi:gliding motility-associated-like protein
MGGTPPYSYEWVNIPNADEAVVTGLCHGTYFLIVTDANGCSSAEVQGTVDNQQFDCFEERVVITPDGNGSNDEFIIFCLTDIYNENELEIYNRWGQLVFQTTNYDNTWEGTAQNGDDLPAGPYYWVLDYVGNNGERDQRRGSLTIVRND